MKAVVYSKSGNKKNEIVLNPEIFGSRINERLLELVQNAFAANLRKGTVDTKTRKEVRGGGKKPWKQKGTGRARHGSSRSPIWKGGGTVFGPHQRDYTVHLSKATRNAALVSALSLRASEKGVLVVEDMGLDTGKTKEFADIVKSLPLQEKRTYCVVKEIGENLRRASRNMRGLIEVLPASDLNAYHVLQRERLLIEQEALPVLESRLLDGSFTKSGSVSGESVSDEAEAKVKEKKATKSAKKKTDKTAKAKKTAEKAAKKTAKKSSRKK